MTENKKRIVIKIGTSVLTRSAELSLKGKNFSVREDSALGSIVRETAELKSQGHEVILVTSGAIGAGIKKLGWHERPDEMRKKQASAAVGQVSLMQVYQKLFESHDVLVAQVLLTRNDFEDRKRYLNVRNTVLTLLELGVVPVINENDTVAVDEIKFGDNDQLSALVAAKIDADLLIILSDIDGLYRSMKDKEIVSVVPKITPEIEKLIWKDIKSELGTGGMGSKIEAAKIAVSSGVTVNISNAFRKDIVRAIVSEKNVGTTFLSKNILNAKEKWILFGAVPKGEVVIDSGAVHALEKLGKSLLPAGIREVRGLFKKEDVVKIKTEHNEEVARGIVSFSSSEIEKIMGKQSGEIEKILGLKIHVSEAVHRDSLVLIPSLWK